MAEVTSRNAGFSLPHIADPEVRRAVKAVYDELMAIVSRQQYEIDALLEVLLDRHLTSVGEFRRLIMRLQQDRMRTNRLHEAISQMPPSAGAGAGSGAGTQYVAGRS